MKLLNNQSWQLLSRTIFSWREDYAPSMGAALAFYTMFSITPLLLIVIAVTGYFLGAQAARGEIYSQLTGLIGNQGSLAVEGLLASANGPVRRSMEAGVGIVVFLIGATSVFNELQDSLNRIWRAPKDARPGGFFSLVRARLLSFGMILAITFLLMVSLLVSAALSGLSKLWGPLLVDWEVFALIANFVLSFALITVMFAMIYKIIPQKKIRWHDVWMGAATTAMLFTVGKELIGLYLGRSVVASAFGAVGSLAVFLLWVYYSAQIFLLGAEFTRVYSTMRSEKEARDDGKAGHGKAEPLPSPKGSRPIPHRDGIR